MNHDFEARLAQIAWLVLAGACRPAETATPSGATGTATTVDLATPDAGATATPIATSEPDASVTTTPPSPGDPRAICVQYQAKAASDPNGPRTQTASPPQRVYAPPAGDDLQARRIDPTKVECRIIWERNRAMETIMVAPTCCPQPRMTTPCPPASPQQFPGERTKVEIAILNNDGSRVSGTLAWNQWVQEPPRHMCGRRPEGFAPAEVRSATAIGARLAEMAELEAASISAFDRLARELAAHGAPEALVARARTARRDEIRHARSMRSLARRFGATPRAPRGAKLAVRARVAVAIENAVEGCVFETFGAVVATFQGSRAEDPAVRATFAGIAADERRHAALAWDVDAWLATICSAEEREAVDRARRHARDRLRIEPPTDDAHAERALGLPTGRERDALVRGVSATLGDRHGSNPNAAT